MRVNLVVRRVLAAVLATALCGPAAAQQKKGPRGPIDGTLRFQMKAVKDPCQVADATKLKELLSMGLAGYFPLHQSEGGEHVTISNPTITNATCPNLRLTMRARIRYQKTRGLDQYSVSGEVRFTSPLEARITHLNVAPGAPIPAADIVAASACLTNIDVVGLDLKNVPNWLDDGWVKEKVIDPRLDEKCFDITNLVKLYLQNGGVITAGS